MKTERRTKEKERRKAREEGWDESVESGVQEYNALFDPNMRHFFETPSVQGHLLKTGQIDRNGRVIDFEKQKSKLHIIEREFKQAERIEFWRHKEERDMRERVQKKRAFALERARKEEMVLRLHEDRKIRQEIVRTSLEAQGALNFGGPRGGGARTTDDGVRRRSRTGHLSRGRTAERSSNSPLTASVRGDCGDCGDDGGHSSSRTFLTQGGGGSDIAPETANG